MKIAINKNLFSKNTFTKPENIFTILAFLFGAIFICFFPLAKTPDEYAHFTRIYSITEGHIIPKDIEKTKLPKSIVDIGKDLSKTNYSRRDLLKYRPKNSEIVDGWSSANSYNPIAYIPQVIVVYILKIFNCPIIIMMYVLRLSSLLLWIIIIYLSIRTIPWRKWTIVGISLFPTMVMQSVSPGADAIQIGAGLLFLAIISKSLDSNSRHVERDYIILLLLAIFFTAAKITSIFLLPAVFLYGTKDKDNKKSILYKTLIASIPLIIAVFWMVFMAPEDTRMEDNNSLLTIFKPLYNTILSSPDISDILTWLIGNFAHIPIRSPIIFTVCGYILATLYLVSSYDNKSWTIFNNKSHTVIFALCLAGLIGTPIYAMWSTFTPVGMNTIIGIQGRYFYPAFFGIGVLASSRFVRIDEEKYLKMVIVGSILINIIYWLVFINYYTGFNLK